jgi:tRNA (guanine37-N1)-methyltransferase
MQIEVITLFPRMIAGALEFGIVGRAIERRILRVATEDPRSHASDAHRTVDDRPYGGGPGMVLKPEPMLAAIRAAHARLPAGSPRVYLSAQGEPFSQAHARELAQLPGLLLVAGRYEGMDERVIELGIDRELSVGDYVLSGGELPALTVIDALARLLPGALGDERSSVEDSFTQELLDWPHYTRPEVFEGRSVPPVLLCGDHARIRRWRLAQAVGRTLRRRPGLLGAAPLAPEVQRALEEFQAGGSAAGVAAAGAAAGAAGSADRGK